MQVCGPQRHILHIDIHTTVRGTSFFNRPTPHTVPLCAEPRAGGPPGSYAQTKCRTNGDHRPPLRAPRSVPGTLCSTRPPLGLRPVSPHAPPSVLPPRTPCLAHSLCSIRSAAALGRSRPLARGRSAIANFAGPFPMRAALLDPVQSRTQTLTLRQNLPRALSAWSDPGRRRGTFDVDEEARWPGRWRVHIRRYDAGLLVGVHGSTPSTTSGQRAHALAPPTPFRTFLCPTEPPSSCGGSCC